MKSFDPKIDAQISAGNVKRAWLLKIHTSAPILRTNASFEIDDNGELYLNSSDLIGLDDLSQKAEITNESTTITFALNSPITAAAYNNELTMKKVSLFRAWLDTDNSVIEKKLKWSGQIKSYSDDDNDNIISLTVGNAFSLFSHVNSWRTTPESHKKRFPNDECFKYAARAADVIIWGGEMSGGSRANNTSKDERHDRR